MKRRWSEADKSKAAQYWQAGVTTPTIANTLGRSEKAVISAIDRMRDEEGLDLALRNSAGAVRRTP